MLPGLVRRYGPALVAAGILSSTLFATTALADVTISSDATQDMSCSDSVCAPTAMSAVLNVVDLEALLASGNVMVTSTGSGVQADNIDVTAKLGWSANALTLDAYQSLSVTAPVTVKGKSGLAILTNDGDSGGELAFSGKGHVTFKKLAGRLSINGTAYTLENSIAALAAAIKKTPSGAFALAADYNAANDGTYSTSPIATTVAGSFEGLGNAISNLAIQVPLVDQSRAIGLFVKIGPSGRLADLRLERAVVAVLRVKGKQTVIGLGTLAGANQGTLSRMYVSGSVSAPKNTIIGGLIGSNTGTVAESASAAGVELEHVTVEDYAGSLMGLNQGQIYRSYATSSVTVSGSLGGVGAGGLVGESWSPASISDCYATGNASGNLAGGLIGGNSGSVESSYSIGVPDGISWTGGFIGDDGSQSGSLTDDYWDTDTSGVTNLGQGAGNIANDPGITGLTTEQLQSGLPNGFDPTVWGESADINGGLPYLLSNPPK